MKQLFIALFLIVYAAVCCSAPKKTILPADLKCEYLVNPINIDVQSPSLSWKLTVSDKNLRGIYQISYHVLAASSPKILDKNTGDLWDSGIIRSSSLSGIIYKGKKLQSFEKCYWKVIVADNKGNEAESGIAEWKMCLLDKKDWDGSQWIALGKDERTSPLCNRSFFQDNMKESELKGTYPSSLMRKEFIISKTVKIATAAVAGAGYAELYINGNKISDNVLDPGQTNYDVFSLYTTYDITDKLKSGNNAAGIMLGNGFYGQNIGFVNWLEYGRPRVRCKIFIEYSDGQNEIIGSGADWTATASPIVFDNVYAGESYDARLEKKGWSFYGYNDMDWQKAEVAEAPSSNDSLVSQMQPAIKKMQVIKPVKIFPTPDGKWIVDLGQNIAGWTKIHVKEKAGQVITMRLAETLSRDNKELDFASTGHMATGFIQTNIYVCKGKGWEDWEPRFTYAGFRYIELSGLSHKPDIKNIQGVVVHTDIQRRGDFNSSDTVLNKIYNTSMWTILDNIHSVPEDCPHREKCGWLGDAHTTAETDLYNFDMARFYIKYLQDIKSQLGRGGQTYKKEPATPGIPANIAPGRRVCEEARVDWGAALIFIPYDIYKFDGDIRAFKELYPNMKDLVKYIGRYLSADGIVQNGYGDWCPPKEMECPPELTSTAFYYDALRILSVMADKLNDHEYSQWCRQQSEEVKNNFNKVYLKPVDGTDYYTYGSQTAISAALRFKMVPDDKISSVAKGLVYDIEKLHSGHISVGIHGRFLYSVLCDLGYEDVAYKIMTQPSYPSLAYNFLCGLTTWPEGFVDYNDIKADRSGSLNHPMQAGFASFFHESIGGIRPVKDEEGFGKFQLKPYLTDKLKWAKSSFTSQYGEIKSEWENKKSKFVYSITVPCNTTATVYLPADDADRIEESGHPVSKSDGVKFIKTENYRQVVELGSGYYKFVCHTR